MTIPNPKLTADTLTRPSLVGRCILVVLIVLLAVVVDQASKWAALTYLAPPVKGVDVLPFLSLRLGINSGISFGLFQSTFAQWPGVLIGFNSIVVIAFLGWAIVTPSKVEAIALSLLGGGALGNIVDRVRQGAVTDFLDLHWKGWLWPTFNLADVAIVLGVGLLLFAAFRQSPLNKAAELGPQNNKESRR